MTGQDPFELLASLRGSDADAYLEPGDDAAADALLEQIMSGDSGQRSNRRVRRRLVVVGVMAGVIVGSGAVVAALWFDQPSDPTVLSCYSEASTDPAVQVGLTVDPDSTPAEQCASLWRDGTLGSGEPPPLTACVTENGITGVLPGDEGTCEALGLASRDPEVTPDQALAARILSTISDHYPTECIDSVDAAVSMIETILDDLGVDGWEVRTGGVTTADRPCAYSGVIADERVVLVMPAAGPRG